MKGDTTIKVIVKDDIGIFPVTETYTISRDNTYEHIDEWIDVFNKMLYCVGFVNKVCLDEGE